MPTITGKWGLLPFAAAALVFVAMRLGALLFPKGTAADRAVGGALSALAFTIVGTRVFGLFGLLTTPALAGALAVLTLVLVFAGRERRFAFPWGHALDLANAPLLLAAVVAVGIAVVAASWLPVWPWDSIGYHLPYVAFSLYDKTTAAVPAGIPYISTYPHDIELFMIALRAMLPDDRLVDLAQIPFALFGAIATAGIARKAGAKAETAVGAGAAWIVVPAVFLQMPTNYVDVGCAALLLSAFYFVLPQRDPALDRITQRTSFVLGALALGLYLGSKPNAPSIAAVTALFFVARALRTNDLWPTIGALAASFAFGSEAFVRTYLRHGNPIWPAKVDLGPIHLPGTLDLHRLLESGANAPRLHGPLPFRIVRSWVSLDAPPVFDMRYGGFGALFVVALAFALFTLVRTKRALPFGLFVCAVAAPDPGLARYVLAFPALVFAFAAPCFDRTRARGMGLAPSLGVLCGALAMQQLTYAYKGLTVDAPPLFAFAHMSEAERSVAIGADGSPLPYIEAKRRIADDESFAFDSTFDLPYLAWDQLRYRVVFIPDDLQDAEVGPFLDRWRVRVLEAKDDGPTGRYLANHPESFTKLFSSNTVSCSVYARL